MPMSPALTPQSHRAALDAAAADGGYLRDLGSDHIALFRPGNGTLLVEFTDLPQMRARDDGLPWNTGLARKRGWATLTVAAIGATWFRDRSVHDFFDGLTDDGMFDDYDNVVFAGGAMGAYGAAAHSVAAPGARLFLVQPYATLDRDVAPWEPRFRRARHLSFGPRYGNAARMIDAAASVHLVTDPWQPLDAMHASLFQGDHVTRLVAPFAGRDIWARLDGLGLLDRMVAGVKNDGLTPLRFAELWRARRTDPDWTRAFLRRVETRDRPWLTALTAGHILDGGKDEAVRRRLNAALTELREAGRTAPDGTAPADALLAGE